MAQFHRLSFCVGVKKLFHIKLKCPSNIILSVVVNGHGVHTVTIFKYSSVMVKGMGEVKGHGIGPLFE